MTFSQEKETMCGIFNKAFERQYFSPSDLIVSCIICQISIVFPDESDKLCSHLRKYFSADRDPD